MSEINTLLQNEIYPRIFDRANEVFPEHDFKEYRYGWGSKTYLDGKEHPHRHDKTKIKKSAISLIFEEGGEALSIWDYVKDRDGLATKQEVYLKLAEMAGVTLPSGELSEEQLENIRAENRTAKIREDSNLFFMQCLYDGQNAFAKTVKAEKLRLYLTEERGYNMGTDYRGWSIPANRKDDHLGMELGFIPSQAALREYLIKEKGHGSDDVNDLVRFRPEIGDSHILTLPFRDPVGKIRGFIFRTTGNHIPKYIYSSGLKKDDTFFNLNAKGDNKDLVIVEGVLDASFATARGIRGVAALGRYRLECSASKGSDKIWRKKITLALDNDAAGTKATRRALTILKDFDLPVFVATYPAGVKDADELIRKQGPEAFQKIIDHADPHFIFTLNTIIEHYAGIQEAEGHLTGKQQQSFQENIVTTAAELNPLERDVFIKEVLSAGGVAELGITAEALKATAETIRYRQDQEAQNKQLRELLAEAEGLSKKGETGKAINLLDDQIKIVKTVDKITKIKALLATDMSEVAIRQRLQSAPTSIKTGYNIPIEGHYEDLEIPAGVLSFIAAPTNHGKTAFLINIGLNIVQNTDYPDKNVYLLTTEESADKIISYCLNTFINETLNAGTRQRDAISYYLKTGDPKWISRDMRSTFLSKKDIFFERYIQTKRFNILYVSQESDELIETIKVIHSLDPNAIVLMDYIQKLRRTTKGNIPARQAELKFICEDLETCANLTGLPILLGTQFNREVLNPLDMHPTKMAEASDIEKTAAEIIGLWNCTKDILARGEKDKRVTDAEREFDFSIGEPLVILKLLKSRSLPTGHYCKAGYEGRTGKITPVKVL